MSLVNDDSNGSGGEVVERAYWVAKVSPEILQTIDELLKLAHEVDPEVNPKYKKRFITLAADWATRNFFDFYPRKRPKGVQMNIKLPQSKGVDDQLADAGVYTMPYDNRAGSYKIHVAPGLDEKQREVLRELIRRAVEETRKG